jgi:hypothetical protein
MQLISSPASPFGRKVNLVIAMKNLKEQVEIVPVDATKGDATLNASNPLGRIPALVAGAAPPAKSCWAASASLFVGRERGRSARANSLGQVGGDAAAGRVPPPRSRTTRTATETSARASTRRLVPT